MSGVAPAATVGSPSILKLGRSLVQRLFILLRTARLYDSANVNVQEAALGLAETIRAVHGMEGSVRLALVYDYLTLNDVRLKTDITGHATFREISEGFAERSIGLLVFEADVSADELLRLAREYYRVKPEDEDPFGTFEEGLRRAAIRSIHAEEAVELGQKETHESLKENLKRRSVKTFFQAISLARQVLNSSDPAKVNFKKAKRVIHNMVDVMAEDESFLLSLTMIKNYDDYTFNHSANVAVYSIAFGQKMGLGKAVLADLGLAALFHDIGKTRVPKEILNKPAKLAPDEWEIMKNHAVYGAETLLKARLITDSVIRNILVAFEHHLNLDLGGYPAIRDRRELNLFSKIVAVADCFDALITPRVYRSFTYAPQEAMSLMMEGRGSLFDPVLLKIFVNTVGVYPVGTLVELDTGEMAVVIRAGHEAHAMDRPWVKVFADSSGKRIPDRTIDLAREEAEADGKPRVARTVDPADYFESIEDYLEIL